MKLDIGWVLRLIKDASICQNVNGIAKAKQIITDSRTFLPKSLVLILFLQKNTKDLTVSNPFKLVVSDLTFIWNKNNPRGIWKEGQDHTWILSTYLSFLQSVFKREAYSVKLLYCIHTYMCMQFIKDIYPRFFSQTIPKGI